MHKRGTKVQVHGRHVQAPEHDCDSNQSARRGVMSTNGSKNSHEHANVSTIEQSGQQRDEFTFHNFRVTKVISLCNVARHEKHGYTRECGNDQIDG